MTAFSTWLSVSGSGSGLDSGRSSPESVRLVIASPSFGFALLAPTEKLLKPPRSKLGVMILTEQF